jgi:hypothetical protein
MHEKDGVRLTATCVTAKAGLPVKLRLELSNNGPSQASLAYDRYEKKRQLPIVKIELVGADGKAVLLTRYGYKHSQSGEDIKVSGTERDFATGDRFDVSVPNLALIYDLTVPGEYDATITACVQIGTPGSRSSIELKVKTKVTIEEP